MGGFCGRIYYVCDYVHINICNSLMLVAAEELVFSELTASSPELRTKGVKNHLVKFTGGAASLKGF